MTTTTARAAAVTATAALLLAGVTVPAAGPADAAAAKSRSVGVRADLKGSAAFGGTVAYTPRSVRVKGRLNRNGFKARGKTVKLQGRLQYVTKKGYWKNGRAKTFAHTSSWSPLGKKVNRSTIVPRYGNKRYRQMLRVCTGSNCSGWKGVTPWVWIK